MRLLDLVASGTSLLGRGALDSKRAATFVRHTLRGNRVAPPKARMPEGSRAPVLLIHGYLATRGSLHLLERRLTERGHFVLSYRLGLVHAGDICESAATIATQIEAIAARTGLERMDIVGHSMGGLVGLYYLKRMGGRRRVRRLVMLGTPASGTWSALAGIALAPLGKGSLQLLPDSSFLRALAATPLPAGVEVFSVAGDRDLLAPPVTTRIAGGRHLRVSTNHAGLLVDARVADLVDELLAGSAPRIVDG